MEKPGSLLPAAMLILALAAAADSDIDRPGYRIELAPDRVGFTLMEEMAATEEYIRKILDGLDYHYEELRDPCLSNPCLNLGTCVTMRDGFECRCTTFFSGKYCEKAKRPCRRSTCNHGECVLTKTEPYFKCRCHYPYHGSKCTTALAPCTRSPCLNGGICRAERNNTFNCLCPQPYRGKLCESVASECFEADGFEYRGRVSQTDSGYPCLPWDSYLLVKEEINAFKSGMKEQGLGEHNYCRNPDGTEKPWCYFRDANGRISWDLCAIPRCVKSLTPDRIPAPGPAPRPTLKVLLRPTTNPVMPVTPQPAAAFTTCGVPEILQNRGRIFGGKRAAPGRHPWQASIGLKVQVFSRQPGHLCGGSLISSCWVLSAAHCFQTGIEAKHLKISLGKQDIQKNETHEQIFDVKEIILHEQYRDEGHSLHNDIALLKLKKVNGKCAQETKYVKTICLPDKEFPPGKNCFISGWGKSETGYPAQLLDANVMIISEARCSEPQSYGKYIDDSMLCAGVLDGGTDTCQGDSGGPLACESDGPFHLTGVVSWGDGCAVKDKPGVYAHVYRLLPWIRNKIKTPRGEVNISDALFATFPLAGKRKCDLMCN